MLNHYTCSLQVIKKELWSEGKILPRYIHTAKHLKCHERVLELLAEPDEGVPPS